MAIKTREENGKIIIDLEGRIDSNNASDIERELFAAVAAAGEKGYILDADNLAYISSAGLRVLMKLRKTNPDLTIRNVSSEVYEIFEVTGFTEIFNVKRALRTISVEGCEVIGRGFYGTVYRIDEDTIVKVYESPDSIPMIENEQRRAKQAFLKGIPTAISYDVVKVGQSYGSVFELLRAKTLNDILREDPGSADEIIRKFVDFMKLVHGTKMEHGVLPNAADLYTGYLDTIAGYLTEEQHNTLKRYLREFPEDDHVVHLDFHMKNVMITDDEPMLIDMDTMSCGHPIFDLAGLYVTYQAFKEDEPDNGMKFLGLTSEMCDYIWNGITSEYFNDRTPEEKESISSKIKLAAMIRFLFIIAVSDLKDNEIGPMRIRHATEHIEELLNAVDGLYFDVERK